MRSEPIVSIILPTFNRVKTLKRAVDHVIRQTYKNWELLIIDDHSTDGTAAYLNALKKQDRRIKTFRPKIKGYPHSRTYGIRKATGELVTFLDDDDYYKSNHLQRAIRYFIKHPETTLLHGSPKILGSKMFVNIHPPHGMVQAKRCIIFGTMFIPRRVLKKIALPKSSYGDDYFIHNQVAKLGHRCHKINMHTYVYDRRGANSISKKRASKKK